MIVYGIMAVLSLVAVAILEGVGGGYRIALVALAVVFVGQFLVSLFLASSVHLDSDSIIVRPMFGFRHERRILFQDIIEYVPEFLPSGRLFASALRARGGTVLRIWFFYLKDGMILHNALSEIYSDQAEDELSDV